MKRVIMRSSGHRVTRIVTELDYAHMAKALEALVTAKQLLKTQDRATFPCPTCGKTLTCWVEGRKRHSRGKCETKDCVAWLE